VFGKFTRKIRLTEDIQVSSKSIKSFAIVISILLSLSNTTSLMPIQASSIKWIKINLSIHGLFGFDR